jgi:hypothetical protein
MESSSSQNSSFSDKKKNKNISNHFNPSISENKNKEEYN